MGSVVPNRAIFEYSYFVSSVRRKLLVGWLFWALRLFETIFQSISGRLSERGRQKRIVIDERKMSKQSPPARTASTIGPCPTVTQVGRTHRHWKSRKENPQKQGQLSSRSHPRHLVGKRTAQKDITIDTTSDSQVNGNFPNRWSPASLTFNNYFYLFLYLYIT